MKIEGCVERGRGKRGQYKKRLRVFRVTVDGRREGKKKKND